MSSSKANSEFFYIHSSFQVGDVVESVKSIRENLNNKGFPHGGSISERCAFELDIFAQALDARENWAIRSEITLVSIQSEIFYF